MQRRRIVFLAVNSSYSHSSLAAWCLRACADRATWDWRTVEATIHEDPAAVFERVRAAEPDVLAATLYLFTRPYVTPILRRLKQAAHGCRVIVGGPECLGDNRRLVAGDSQDGLRREGLRPFPPFYKTPYSKQTVGREGLSTRNLPAASGQDANSRLVAGARVADVAVRGEGEIALRQWLEAIGEPARWPSVAGLCGTLDGVYFDGGTAAAVESLDDIPPFYEEALAAGFSRPFVQLETSRGCSNGCLFCTSRHTRLRYKSLERVRGDLAAIRNAGIPEVRVVDRTFNETEGRALELIRLFRDEFPVLRFHLELEPARVSDALIRELAEAPGRFHVEAGVQSLSPTVYSNVERAATCARTLAGVGRLCAVQGLATHVDLVAGLPGSSLGQVRADIRGVMDLRPDEIQLERLKLLPGTPLAETPERWGLTAAPEPPYPVLGTPDLSPEDLCRVDRWSRLLDRYYNVPVLRPLVAEAARAEPDFLERFDEWTRSKSDGDEACPSLEQRFRILDGYLSSRGSELRHRLRYLWLKLGFSARRGLVPAAPWKKPIPDEAVLVEGDAGAAVARVWRAPLERPYLFCIGAGANGARAVVAVYGLPRDMD